MAITTRGYEAKDFARLHRLDQDCFPPGIAYSKWSLRYYLSLPGADCLVAEDGKDLAGFILAEDHPPLGHIITLDVAEKYRRRGVGTRAVFPGWSCPACLSFGRREAQNESAEVGGLDAHAPRSGRFHGSGYESGLVAANHHAQSPDPVSGGDE